MIKQIQVWCQTDIGLKRTNNEDFFLIDPDLGLYVIADGMGGHKGGEVASQMAVQTIREVVTESFEKESGVKPQELLQKAYSLASQKIFDKSTDATDLKGMGTTLVVALVRDDKIFIANVGDSRAYLANRSGFWQITEDHSLVNEQMKAGLITEEGQSMSKNVITRSVGFERVAICDVLERQMQEEDCFLMCTDGLTGMIPDTEIYKITQNYDANEVVGNLILEAKNRGGFDNITAMYLRVSSAV